MIIVKSESQQLLGSWRCEVLTLRSWPLSWSSGLRLTFPATFSRFPVDCTKGSGSDIRAIDVYGAGEGTYDIPRMLSTMLGFEADLWGSSSSSSSSSRFPPLP
jgi:hypothetical protein